MHSRPLDTTRDAADARRSALGRLDPAERVQAALEMSDSMRRIRLSGLRASLPDAAESELVARFIARVHGVHVDGAR